MITSLHQMFKYRHILFATTFNEIRSRYIGTLLGLSWTILYPLLFLSLYAVIYTFVLKIRISGLSTQDYMLMIFSGLIPFLGFSEALGNGVTCVTSNSNLIKSTLFPIELLPIKAVLSSSTTMIIGLCVLLPLLWLRGVYHSTQLLIPFIIILQLMFTCGIIWLLSALNVFFRDLGQMVSIIILFLMLVSPIGYTPDMIPPRLMILMYPNPLFYLIMLYRDAIIYGHIQIKLLVTFSMISSFIFIFGYYVFSRLKVIFADFL